jgi:hypothetical protein
MAEASENAAEKAEHTVGERFAHALAAKDGEALLGLLADPVDFQALTPGRHWQTDDPRSLVEDILLGAWFNPTDDIRRLLAVGVGAVGDRRHLSYRFALRNTEGDFTVEQQVYYLLEGARISWMRVLCSGFRASSSVPDTL